MLTRRGLIVGFWVVLFELQFAKAACPQAPCYRFKLHSPISWVGAVVVRESDSSLIIVDSRQGGIRVVSASGTEGAITFPVKDALPATITQADNGNFLVEFVDGSLAQFDSAFAQVGERAGLPTSEPDGISIGSLYQWKLAGQHLVAYGALKERSDVRLGFFRVRLGGASPKPELLTPFEDTDFYVLGNPYITSIGGTAYYIVMSKRPAIYRAIPGSVPVKLSAFPGQVAQKPEFQTRMTGPRNAAPHFRELETFAVASGLYSQDGRLYLLSREPISGATSWFLYGIDPVADRIVSRTKLPTKASHLSVAASKTKWYLVERGEVGEMQKQKNDTVVVIDSFAIRNADQLPVVCPAN